MKYAEVYEAMFGRMSQDFLFLKKLLAEAPEGAVVEMGAGSGRLLPLLSDRDAVMVESDRDMLAILKSKAAGMKNVSVLASHAHATKLPSEFASVVLFAFNSIAEMGPTVFCLCEAARILKTGGILYIMVANPSGFRTSARGLQRTTALGVEGMTISAETFPLSQMGPYYFQAHILGIGGAIAKKWIVEQTYPPFSFWSTQLASTGFEVLGKYSDYTDSPFNEETSPVLILKAEKSASKLGAAVTSNSKSVEAAFDWFAPRYADTMKRVDYAVPGWFKSQINQYYKLRPTVLDLGCGSGLVGCLLAEAGVNPEALYGIDLSSKMVQLAGETGYYFSVFQSDLSLGLPIYESLCFDIITAFGILEFIEDIEKILFQIHNSLRIGGEAFLSFEVDPAGTRNEVHFNGGAFVRHARTSIHVLNLFKKFHLSVENTHQVRGYQSPSTGKDIEYLLVRVKRRHL